LQKQAKEEKQKKKKSLGTMPTFTAWTSLFLAFAVSVLLIASGYLLQRTAEALLTSIEQNEKVSLEDKSQYENWKKYAQGVYYVGIACTVVTLMIFLYMKYKED
jgi:flagellar biosynthesis protein FlhB